MFQFIDEDLSHTQELTLTVSTLRRFRNTISMTIEAWEILEQRDITTFEPIGFNLPTWQERIGEVREYVDTLKSYQTLLTQRLDSFNNMRDGVSNIIYLCLSKLGRKVLHMTDGERVSTQRERCGNYTGELHHPVNGIDSGKCEDTVCRFDYLIFPTHATPQASLIVQVQSGEASLHSFHVHPLILSVEATNSS